MAKENGNARFQRRAALLRENLAKRKSRARDVPPPDLPPSPAPLSSPSPLPSPSPDEDKEDKGGS